MNRKFEMKLKYALQDVFSVEPNNLGNSSLTAWYGRITDLIKIMPFRYIIPLSLLAAIILYLVFGHLLIRLVSLLQYGF